MNRFITVSIALVLLMALLNMGGSKIDPEYEKYDRVLRSGFLSLKKGENSEEVIKDTGIVIRTDNVGKTSMALIFSFNEGSCAYEEGLRKAVSAAIGGEDFEFTSEEGIDLVLCAYSDSRFFTERVENYKAMIEGAYPFIAVNVVTDGVYDLKEEAVSDEIFTDASLYLPGSAFMKAIGICDE